MRRIAPPKGDEAFVCQGGVAVVVCGVREVQLMVNQADAEVQAGALRRRSGAVLKHDSTEAPQRVRAETCASLVRHKLRLKSIGGCSRGRASPTATPTPGLPSHQPTLVRQLWQ